MILLHPWYIPIIRWFKAECDSLISEFEQKHSDNFSDFADLFKSKKFNLLYEKYVDSFIYHDFKEDSLQIAKCLMLNEHFVGGMYLMYSLHYMQDQPKQPIRLELKEFEKIVELIREERHTLLGTCQPGFVFAKMLRNDVFDFTYCSRNYSMEEHPRTRLVYGSNASVLRDSEDIDRKKWLENFLKDTEFMDDFKRVDEEYFAKKCKLKEEHSELNLGLDMLPEDTLGGLMKAILEDENNFNPPPTIGIGNNRRKIKKSAFKRKRESLNTGKSSRRRRKIGVAKGKYELTTSDEDDIDNVAATKKRGRPRGARKTYFSQIVNEPDSIASDSSDSVEYQIRDLPTLD